MGYFSIKELGLPENSWSAFETHHHTVPFPPGKLIYLQGSPRRPVLLPENRSREGVH